ncbi:MAG: PEP-CTERM sorting domain-containing protein [Rubrivivax sp.]|nr:PEP-CTERM sorting domain-containing protein [Rubrivivax sp.]
MKSPTGPRQGLTLLLLACAALAAQASPTVYEGYVASPDQKVDPSGLPATSRSAFQATLDAATIKREDFEVFSRNDVPSTLFGGVASLLNVPSGTGRIENVAVDVSGDFPGRFNTTGTNTVPNAGTWWQSTDTFTIDFGDAAYSAFGFYGTDIGDFNGALDITFSLDGGSIHTEIISDTPAETGSLRFWGITDSNRKFDKLVFRVYFQNACEVPNECVPDFAGFDDLIVANLPTGQPMPEPTSLALVGLSLLGLAASRRRRD